MILTRKSIYSVINVYIISGATYYKISMKIACIN